MTTSMDDVDDDERASYERRVNKHSREFACARRTRSDAWSSLLARAREEDEREDGFGSRDDAFATYDDDDDDNGGGGRILHRRRVRCVIGDDETHAREFRNEMERRKREERAKAEEDAGVGRHAREWDARGRTRDVRERREKGKKRYRTSEREANARREKAKGGGGGGGIEIEKAARAARARAGAYRAKWRALEGRDDAAKIDFSDFPFIDEEILRSREILRAFLTDGVDEGGARARLREEMTRWHPDKFAKRLALAREEDVERVRERVNITAQAVRECFKGCT